MVTTSPRLLTTLPVIQQLAIPVTSVPSDFLLMARLNALPAKGPDTTTRSAPSPSNLLRTTRTRSTDRDIRHLKPSSSSCSGGLVESPRARLHRVHLLLHLRSEHLLALRWVIQIFSSRYVRDLPSMPWRQRLWLLSRLHVHLR
jgi:hypothetical protein